MVIFYFVILQHQKAIPIVSKKAFIILDPERQKKVHIHETLLFAALLGNERTVGTWVCTV